MPQKTSPFLEGKWGWNYGESGWNSGADENWLKFSYMFDSNVDAIVSTLPVAVNGEAYFLTTDNRIYFVVDGTYYSTPVPKWFEFKVKSTGDLYRFNGASAELMPGSPDLLSRIEDVEADVSTKVSSSALSSASGASLVGYRGRSQEDKNADIVSLLDFLPLAIGDGVTNNQAAISAAVIGANGRTIYVPVDESGGQYAITSGSVDLAGINLIYESGARIFAQGGTITNQPNFYSIFSGNSNSIGRTSRSHGSIHELRDELTGIAYGAGADTYAIHRMRIYNDRLDAVSDPAAGTKVDGLLVHHTYGGTGTQGGRHGIEGILDQVAITEASNTDRNYAAVVGLARTSVGDGGTLGTEKGAYFGGNFYGSLTNGAMHCYNVTACEFNVAIGTGASAKYRSGIQIVGGGVSRGTETDAALSVSNLGTATAFWKDGILFGRQNGQPSFNSTSSVIRVDQESVDRVINLETIGTLNHILYHPTVKLTTSFLEMTAQSPSLRMGASGVANTPFFRFRSGATAAPGYDSQILASGGNGADGNGTLSVTAATCAVSGALRSTSDALQSNGTQSNRWLDTFSQRIRPGTGAVIWTSGAGTPEGAVTAVVGSMYTRTDGGANTTLYIKESGTGNTGWVAK